MFGYTPTKPTTTQAPEQTACSVWLPIGPSKSLLVVERPRRDETSRPDWTATYLKAYLSSLVISRSAIHARLEFKARIGSQHDSDDGQWRRRRQDTHAQAQQLAGPIRISRPFWFASCPSLLLRERSALFAAMAHSPLLASLASSLFFSPRPSDQPASLAKTPKQANNRAHIVTKSPSCGVPSQAGRMSRSGPSTSEPESQSPFQTNPPAPES